MSTEKEPMGGQVGGLGCTNVGHFTRIVDEEIITMGPSLARKFIGTLRISWRMVSRYVVSHGRH